MTSRSTTSYDVIVTGAGIAGMMAACFLARGGRRVLVLEANHQPGGLMAGIWRKGYYFDVGDQSFPNMGVVFPLLDQLGVYDASEWQRSDYQIRMPDLDVVVASLAQTERAMQGAFPQHAGGLARFFRQHHETSALLSRVTGSPHGIFEADGRLSIGRLARVLAPRAPDLWRLLRTDGPTWIREQMGDSGLSDLLARCGYSDMNLFVASAFWHLWARDYWYPRGGLAALFGRLGARLSALGGEVRYRQRVTRYLIEGGQVRGVETAKGEHIAAASVIHTGDLRSAVFDLIGERYFPRRFVRRLRRVEVSDAIVSLYLGVAVPPDELRRTIRASHLFYFPTYGCGVKPPLDDPDYHKSQFLEITAHSLFQPGLAPEGKSSLVVQAFSDIAWHDRWSTGKDGTKAGYRATKRQVGEQMLGMLAPILPGLRDRIEWMDVGSPVSTVRFTGNALGGTCGFALNLRDFPFLPWIGGLRTPVSNLYWAGHYTLWPGSVPMAALSGKLAADRVLAGAATAVRASR